MFRQLRHKLTVLYAGLFCVALMLIGATAYGIIAGATHQLAREQLVNTQAVFEQHAEMRLAHLRDSTQAAASAVGLQAAVSERDTRGIVGALANLRQRTGADIAFLVTREGLIVGADGSAATSVSPGMQRALAAGDAPAGVMNFADTLYQGATAPIPGDLGWLIAGARLDADEMRALEHVSTLPIYAVASARGRDGWSALEPQDGETLNAFLDYAQQRGAAQTDVVAAPDGRALALAAPLPSLDGTRAALLLRYRLSGALSPYGALFGTLFAIGLAGLALLVAGSWFLANSITRPLSTLEVAARKLQDGVFETVTVPSKDELAKLADSFNAMTDAIRERERRITQLAYHDAETRLPNRLALERRLAGAPHAERLYLAAIGVDRFAHVRGAIGYALAGAMVRTLGQRLARLVPNAPMARLSSDVLGVAFLADNDADARKRADALVGALEQPVSLEGHDLDVHVAIGVAQPRSKGESTAAMIERASVALDQARGGRHKVALFDDAAYGDPARNLSLMSEMLRALESGEMQLAHQPKYDFRTGRIASAECLVRWRHPTRGMIAPDLFVPMAEETGHVRALTEWVLRRAIVDQRRLSAAGWPLELAVNISARLLSDDEFARGAVELVRQAPHKLCFEITETAVIDNPKVALDNIERFASAGVHIAIDDYGSGLSSLAYLKQLPAHELKIDKLFVESITASQRDALLVRSTIELAHGLGLDVTAEGVETPAAFAMLSAMKCDLAQGYLVSRPTSIDELAAILGDEKRMRFYQQSASADAGAGLPRTA